MKILIFLIAVVLLLWLLKRSIRRPPPPSPKPRDAAEDVKPMLACAQCGVHLPRDEALPGRGGVFCGEAHRSDYERAHPER
jgi:uncharacterized protein